MDKETREMRPKDIQPVKLFRRYLASYKQELMQQIIIRPAEMRDLSTLLTFEQELIASQWPFDETLRLERFHYYDLHGMIEKEDAHAVVEATGETSSLAAMKGFFRPSLKILLKATPF